MKESVQGIPIDISRGWMPDYVPFAMPKGGLIKCENLLPYDEYYAPALSQLVYSVGAVSGTPLSGIELFSNDGNYYSFIGTSTKLYRLETNYTLSDITRASGGDYATSGNRWYFAQWGEQLVATNYNDAPQILKTALTSANFAALGGTPPKAKYCTLMYGHLILAYLNDGTVYPKKLIWSANENIENFTQSLTTGSDSQTIADATTPITALGKLGNLMIVGHRHSISLGWYSGAPLTFSFAWNKIQNRGIIEGSLIIVDDIAYFFDERDIYMFDGNVVTPIGDGVKRTFLNYIDIGNYHRTTTAYDPRNGYVMWCIISSIDGTIGDKILIYNPKTKKFTLMTTQQHCIWNIHRLPLNADNMDALFPNADEIPFSFDSNYWTNNSPIVACVNSDGKVATFQGPALESALETAEMYEDDKVLYVNRIMPEINNSYDNIRVQIGYRFGKREQVQYTEPITVDDDTGYADRRQSGKYLRIKLITKLHDGLVGITARGKLLGER